MVGSDLRVVVGPRRERMVWEVETAVERASRSVRVPSITWARVNLLSHDVVVDVVLEGWSIPRGGGLMRDPPGSWRVSAQRLRQSDCGGGAP